MPGRPRQPAGGGRVTGLNNWETGEDGLLEASILDEDALRFLLEVGVERRRAIMLHGDEAGNVDADWLAILVEEVGECAKAMIDETDADLRKEIVQAAAMCLR